MSNLKQKVNNMWTEAVLRLANFITACSGIMKAETKTNTNTQKTARASFKFDEAKNKNKGETKMEEKQKLGTILSYVCIYNRDPYTGG